MIKFENYEEPIYTINSEKGVLIGKTKVMLNLFYYLNHLADLPTTVLLRGETGTGKELCARALHYNGSIDKKQGKFVAVNCAKIPSELLESVLFGHVKGSFTGAYQDKIGNFQYANNGTILLDEIGDMNPRLQAKVLRVLQEKQVMKVGSNELEKVNVRVVAATHQNLEKQIQEGDFREDLYYRLNVVPIKIPSLSERREDIPLIAEYLVKKYNKIYSANIGGLLKIAKNKLKSSDWKGNVRELENIIERIFVWKKEGSIKKSDLYFNSDMPKKIWLMENEFKEESSGKKQLRGIRSDGKYTNTLTKEEEENLHIILKKVDGNIREAEKISPWCGSTIRKYRKKFLDVPKGKSGRRPDGSYKNSCPLEKILEIREIYTKCGNISETSRRLKVHRSTVSRYIEKNYHRHGVTKEPKETMRYNEGQNNERSESKENVLSESYDDSSLCSSDTILANINHKGQESKESALVEFIYEELNNSSNITPKSIYKEKQQPEENTLIESFYHESCPCDFDSKIAIQIREDHRYTKEQLAEKLDFPDSIGVAQISKYEQGDFNQAKPLAGKLIEKYVLWLKDNGYDITKTD